MPTKALDKIKRSIRKIAHFGNNAHIATLKPRAEASNGKAALVSYLLSPVLEEIKGNHPVAFSNAGAGVAIPYSLAEMGYDVDVINYDDNSTALKKSYDLVILHGGKNFNHAKRYLKKGKPLVYYSSGSYWKYHNFEESLRFQSFYKRHNKKLVPDRKINDSEEKVNRKADLIISLGNQGTADTYKGFKNVKFLHAASEPERRQPKVTKSRKDSKNYLFMSGPGAIHKGLDRAIDFFSKNSELNLHIMMTLEKDFAEYYKKELSSLPNIHYYGFVPQRTEKYYSIIDKCAFSLLLSCSEGSPGSVIESMHQGLIPIVTRQSHIDVQKVGYIIDELTETSLAKAIAWSRNLTQLQLQKLSRMNTKLVESEYTVDKFKNDLKKIISQVGK